MLARRLASKSNIEQCKKYPIHFGEVKHEIDGINIPAVPGPL